MTDDELLVALREAYDVRAPEPDTGAVVRTARRRRRRRRVVASAATVVVVGALITGALAAAADRGRPTGTIAVRDGGPTPEPADRVTTSPLVAVRTLLHQEPSSTLFTVQVHPGEEAARWRLMALDEFDGHVWGSNGPTTDARDVLAPPDEVTAPPDALHQHTTILDLSQAWLPVAERPIALDIDDVSLIEETDTLLVGPGVATSDGLVWNAVSAPPNFTPDELRTAPEAPPAMAPYLELPGDLDPRVAELAAQITAVAATPYDRAMAIQQFFRSGAFAYDQEIGWGRDEAALTRFLFDTRAGYCEQFAGAYAVLARLAGLPARVAVGFTPGTFDAATSTYAVTNDDAHAWPEVYLEGFGWLAFEPTVSQRAAVDDHTGTHDDG